MRRRVRKWTALILSLAVLFGCLPTQGARAADNSVYDIYYYVPGQGAKYTQVLDEAFMAAYNTPGVTISIRRDRELGIPDFLNYRNVNENTVLTIDSGATVTINKNNLCMNGTLQILGTVDLEHSEGILYGSGTIKFVNNGKLLKRSYDVQKQGEFYLEAKDISYGQKLSEALITTDKVNGIPSIEGTWSFCNEDYVPQAGTRGHDVKFTPKYSMTYETKVFEKGGRVTTKQAVPKLKQYDKPQVHIGENLLEVHPEMTFVNPITDEIVEGEFSFEQSAQLQNMIGEQEVKGTFVPKDENYSSVTQYFKIDVLETEPEIKEVPVIRNQGTYGQTLGDIQYLQGKCTNPYTGKTVKGSWEWSDTNERLILGDNRYKMLFIPEEEGYRTVEIDLSVNTLPKVMEDITWPACSDIIYGQSLSDSALSFTKNEYGTFAWKNENARPAVKNQGAEIVFTPARTDTYDWSRLAGYDDMTKTVTFTIPIQVHSIKGELPTIYATEIKEGMCVSGSALSLQGMEGELEWKDPEQVAEKSDWYEVYYTPLDASNYDWSAYSPELDGRIVMKVYLNVIPKPTATAQPTPIPTETAQPTETLTATAQVTPTPTATVLATQIPDEKLTENNDSTSVDKQSSASTKAPAQNVDSPYIITQLVSRASTITGPVVVKRTAITKAKRKGKKAWLSWKKVAGAKYQVQYSIDKRMKKKKKLSANTTSTTLTGLKKGKTYYVRVRAWKKKNGKKIYGKWCKVRRIK